MGLSEGFLDFDNDRIFPRVTMANLLAEFTGMGEDERGAEGRVDWADLFEMGRGGRDTTAILCKYDSFMSLHMMVLHQIMRNLTLSLFICLYVYIDI